MDNTQLNSDPNLETKKIKVKNGKNILKSSNEPSNITKALDKFKYIKPVINKEVLIQQELFKRKHNNNTKKKLNNITKLKREVNDLISETTPNQPYKLYRMLNDFLNPIVYNRLKSIIFCLLVIIVLVLAGVFIGISEENKGIYIIICVYIALYLFFINAMNIKMSCGKNTSLLELIYPLQSWRLFKSGVLNKNINEYIKIIKDYKCFEYNSDGKEEFTRNNASKIKNLNTNFNKKLSILKNNKPYLNSDYPNRLPSRKYIFLTIYFFSIIFLLTKSIIDEYVNKDKSSEDKGKTEQVINSIIVCLIFFIWTCVLDLPMWILIVLIITLILIYLFIGAADLYSSLSTGGKIDDMLCKPHIIPFVNKSWAGVSFEDNLTNCVNNKGNGMFLTMMKPYLEMINNLEKQVDDQNSKLNNLGNVVDMFQDKVQKMVEPIYIRIKGIIDKIIRIKNKIYDIMRNIILMFKSMIWTMVNLVYSIESINNIICSLPFVNCCFDENTIIQTYTHNNILKNKLIKDIKVGDVLEDNTIVLGIIKSKYTNQDMYSYNDIIVTGNHYVYDNGEHKTIDKCEKSILIHDYKKDYVYCLITSTQKIKINNIIFSDYFDIDDLSIQNEIQNKIISKLNNIDTISSFNYKNKLPLWCFEKSTMIKMYDNSEKEIQHISIGDDTYYGRVRALIKINIDESEVYEINGVITTGDQIVKTDGIWLKVTDLIDSKKVRISDNIFYHIIVDTNRLLINNMMFTDFEQYSNYGYAELDDKSLA
jgi:hypothetical protein